MRRAAVAGRDMGADRDTRRAHGGGEDQRTVSRACQSSGRGRVTNRKDDIVYGGTAPTRAMIRRMQRTHLALVPTEPAARTPAQVIADFFVEHEIEVGDGWAAELSSRLHGEGVIYFDDDGVVLASVVCATLTAIGQAIEKQADLIAEDRWPERNRLRLLVQRYQREIAVALGELGMA